MSNLSKQQIMARLACSKINTIQLRAAGYSASEVLDAGYSAIQLRAAGYSASEVRAAGYSASELRAAGYSASEVKELEDSIPLVENPYSQIWDGIKNDGRKHNQCYWGPDDDPQTNLCKTAMCTAGHLVNLGGKAGYALKNEYAFPTAAALIHHKAHPGWPCQDFYTCNQEQALAYIQEMAKHEKEGTNPDW